MGTARLLDAHDPASWPLRVKLIGVGNRIFRLHAGRAPVIRWTWTVLALPVASVFWAVGLTWNRLVRRCDRARGHSG